MSSEKSVFLAVPHSGNLTPEALAGLVNPTKKHRLNVQTGGCSLLCHNFNILWCTALNARKELGLTHFAMHHSDIAAPPFWMDILLAEQERVGADVLSVVVPIKDERGLTTTGMQDKENLNVTRLTMHEVMALPVTFGIEDTKADVSKKQLAINTGLWVCDFTKPWVEEVCFSIVDQIIRAEEGFRTRFHPAVLSEDWVFSDWANKRGLKVMATRIVPVEHLGRHAYDNSSAWGEWTTEQGDVSIAA